VDASSPSDAPIWASGHASEVTSIALRPDGRSLATGSDDRSIIVWDVGDHGRLIMADKLIGQGEKVTSLTWSDDGRWLASAGEDSHVILWDVKSGLEIGDPIQVVGVPAVAFAPNRDRQLFVSLDGLARWDMRPDAWARIACTITGDRPFSAIEQERYGVPASADAACP
jgi:WD40 repeat protein